MKTAIVVVAMLLSGRVAALERWTSADVALEAAFAAAVLVDVTQTRWALRNGYEEMNPLLGHQPSSTRLVASGLGVVAGHAIVSVVLPPKWRRWWQGVTLTAELGAVGWNAGVGTRLKF